MQKAGNLQRNHKGSGVQPGGGYDGRFLTPPLTVAIQDEYKYLHLDVVAHRVCSLLKHSVTF